MEQTSAVEATPHERAVIAGVKAANERLAASGVDSAAVAFGSPATLSREARVILGAEGASATLRVVRELEPDVSIRDASRPSASDAAVGGDETGIFVASGGKSPRGQGLAVGP